MAATFALNAPSARTAARNGVTENFILRFAATSLQSSKSEAFGKTIVLPSSKGRSNARSLQICASTNSDVTVEYTTERIRLDNLQPQPGSRRGLMRVGRGPGSGKGKTCGRGHKGQKSRAGATVRPGFEGGQTPLYRRLPKLKGIAGGMGAGLPKFVVVNIADLDEFEAGEEVSLDALVEKGILKVNGRERRLPLKVLGDGELKKALTVKAVAFSAAAKATIETAGGTVVELPGKVKWTRAAHKARVAAAAAASS